MRIKEKHYQTTLWGIVLFIILFVWMCSCSGPEQLTEPNLNDRVIVGYSKNMKRYKVTDQFDRPCDDIFIGDTLRPIGGVFIALSRY